MELEGGRGRGLTEGDDESEVSNTAVDDGDALDGLKVDG